MATSIYNYKDKDGNNQVLRFPGLDPLDHIYRVKKLNLDGLKLFEDGPRPIEERVVKNIRNRGRRHRLK